MFLLIQYIHLLEEITLCLVDGGSMRMRVVDRGSMRGVCVWERERSMHVWVVDRGSMLGVCVRERARSMRV